MHVSIERIRPAALRVPENLFQSPLWAKTKRDLGQIPRAFAVRVDGRVIHLLALLSPIGADRLMAYLPWAPDLRMNEPAQGRLLETLSRSMAPLLPAQTVFLRWDLPWRSPYEPACGEYPDSRVREMRMNFGTEEWNLRKAATDHQAPDTVIVDTSRDPERVYAAMRAGTRYDIRAAHRRGVRVFEVSPERLDSFYRLYRETMHRHGLSPASVRHFRALFRAAEDAVPGEPRPALLMAYKDHEPVAGAIVATCGRYACYLYAASSYDRRKLLAPSAVQWRAIELVHRAGCTRYDLLGIPPSPDPRHPMSGLYRFKTGFGGRVVHRRGCWDYPLDPQDYEAYRARERLR